MTTRLGDRRPAARAAGRRRRRSPISTWIAGGLLGAIVLASLVGPWLLDADPTRSVAVNRLLPLGSDGHPLGTDALGRDVLARLVWGGRQALQVGAIVSTASLTAGLALGGLAGHFGGWLDQALSRVVDGMLAFPALLLGLVLAAMFGASTGTAIVALSIAYTPLVARVVRAGVLTEHELDYVRASRGLGNGELRTLVVHILPNLTGPLVVIATVVASRSMIVEASLSFLGVGTQSPRPSWGVMIGDARDFLLIHPRLVILPAATLSATVLAINLLADGLSDRWQTRSKLVEA